MSLTKINNRIYVSGLPKLKDFEYLKEIGIKHVVNLMEKTYHKFPDIKFLHVPVKNYHPPTLDQINMIMNYISETNDEKILIHCYGGLGRTGVIAACYFVRYENLPADEAIKKIRSIRRGSIETKGQEDIVGDYYGYCNSLK